MRLAAALLLAFSCAAFAQVPAGKARLENKKSPQPSVERDAVTRDPQADKAIRNEERRRKTLSNASRERHKDAPNAIRNQR